MKRWVKITAYVKEEQKSFNESDIVDINVKHIVDGKFSINFNFLMYLFSYKGVAVGNDKAYSDPVKCIIDPRIGESHIALYKTHLEFENILKNI